VKNLSDKQTKVKVKGKEGEEEKEKEVSYSFFGKELDGKEYVPLFNYYHHMRD